MKVIVVDDDSDTQAIYELLLQRMGYEYVLVSDAASAVAEMPADALVLDYELKESTGIDVMHRLRAIDPGIPVVFATASAQPIPLSQMEATGAVLLRKPFLRADLAAALEQAIVSYGIP